ncbi:hypothetical protein Noca_3821 [Nocardioides sp. JS614]|nr:hypothetical protein Noca_3821 [Nocardioides sp. JS614]
MIELVEIPAPAQGGDHPRLTSVVTALPSLPGSRQRSLALAARPPEDTHAGRRPPPTRCGHRPAFTSGVSTTLAGARYSTDGGHPRRAATTPGCPRWSPPCLHFRGLDNARWRSLLDHRWTPAQGGDHPRLTSVVTALPSLPGSRPGCCATRSTDDGTDTGQAERGSPDPRPGVVQ